jgi:hypothetical protein
MLFERAATNARLVPNLASTRGAWVRRVHRVFSASTAQKGVNPERDDTFAIRACAQHPRSKDRVGPRGVPARPTALSRLAGATGLWYLDWEAE